MRCLPFHLSYRRHLIAIPVGNKYIRTLHMLVMVRIGNIPAVGGCLVPCAAIYNMRHTTISAHTNANANGNGSVLFYLTKCGLWIFMNPSSFIAN